MIVTIGIPITKSNANISSPLAPVADAIAVAMKKPKEAMQIKMHNTVLTILISRRFIF